MEYITTTNLRTQSSKLIEALKKGNTISLIHRSQVVAEIKPKKIPEPFKVIDIKAIKKIADELNLPKTSYKEREKIYRKHIMKKYGKGLS